MRIDLLGPLRVRGDDGREVPVAGARLRRLLAELALVAGRPVSTGALEDVLWDDARGGGAGGGGAGALQSLVSRLRKVLGGAGVVTAGPAGYTLAVPPQDVDVVRFDRGCARGRELLRAGDVEAAGKELGAALALWRGPLVELDSSPEAPRLTERRLDALADRIEADLRRGALDGLVAELEELTGAHPYRERFAELRVRVLHAAGRTGEALAAYEQTRRLLAEEFGSDPSPGLRAAHLAALTEEPAAPPATDPVPSHGTVPLTSFVGRERDLDRVRHLLETARCVTLVGPGGAGKTRLSGELVRESGRLRPTHVVALAPVTEGADVLGAAVAAVGVQDTAIDRVHQLTTPSENPLERLVAVFTGRPTLLVLDNCEHVLDDSARLVEVLLHRCPELVVLTTSREALGVEGEVLHPLAPLRAPEVGADLVDVHANPAVRLFTDRAVAVAPGFTVTTENSDLVVDLVRRLDGLPLALELAAARLRTMSVADLHDRLTDRFRLLAGGRRTAVARHRTLRAVVDWSWELLDDDERRTLQRLSVFSAPFTVEGAAAVCGVEDDLTVADRLASLTEKSLLHLVEPRTTTDPTRYGQLETIREYGQERLAAADDLEEVREARTQWARRVSAAASLGVRGADQVAWARRLDAESEDLLAGLRHLAATGRGDDALEMVLPVALWWLALGRHTVVREWLRVARSVDVEPTSQAAALATVLDLINGVMGGDGGWFDDIAVLQGVRDDLAAAGGGGHRVLTYFADLFLRAFIDDDGRFPEDLEPGLAGDDPFVPALFHLMRAASAENAGDIATMRRHGEEADRGFRALGESFGLAGALRLLGHEAVYAGDLERAERLYSEAVDKVTAFGTVDDEIHLRMRLTDVLTRSGNLDGAHRQLELMQARMGSSSASTRTWLALVETSVARREGRRTEAREALRQVLGHLDRRPDDPTYAHERAGLGVALAHLDLDEGLAEQARAALETVLPVAAGTHDMPVVASVGTVVARWLTCAGRHDAGARVLGAAAALRGADDPTDPDIIAVRALLVGALGAESATRTYDEGRGLEKAAALALLDPAAHDADLP